MQAHISKIAVIGLGLIGGSIAGAVAERHPNVEILGVSRSLETCQTAVEKGWATRAVQPSSPDFRSFIEDGCDMVIIATPPATVESYFECLAEWGYTGIITDAASTKTHIIEAAARILPETSCYIPGHPMAGSEVNGIAGARTDLFDGAHWILCPDENTPAEQFSVLHEFVTSLGARVISLPREDHDRAVAIVSHVPHIIASSLVELACRHADDQQGLFRLAAGGFKDSTRIAAGSPELWCGIAFDNAHALGEGLEEIREIIGQFADTLRTDDRARMTSLLQTAADARRALPAAWVPSTDKLLEVRIPMEDRRGVVAEVTTIASQVGCNIQSVEIDHITENRAVLTLILTDEGDIGRLSAQLIGAGFTVSFAPLQARS